MALAGSPALSTTFRRAVPVDNRHPRRGDYTGRSARPWRHSPASRRPSADEAHLSAKRPSAEAEARLPRADVDPGRPRHPEAPPREGAQAPFGVDGADRLARVQRKNRLSRSRDFDTVYRHGRSVSTRFLTCTGSRGRGAGRAAARARRAEGDRVERRAQPDQAAAARDLAGEARRRCRRRPERLRARRPARACPRRPRRAATSGSPSGWTRCSERRRHDADASPRGPGLARRSASSTPTAGRSGALVPVGHLQVPPELLGVRARARSASTGSSRARRSPAGALLRCNPWSHGGVDYP